jgi:pimeloyl-ACP methyl ester carboxylesterase
MSGQAIVATSGNQRIGRLQKAEEALWGRYGLHPTVRLVQLADPQARLRVQESGSGRPVLFIHGTIGPGSWPSLVRAMPGVRSLVLDRPGWGPSSPVDFAGKDYRRFVADILRGLLDGLEIERVDVVGGSVGDLWALSLAEHHPDRVDHVVLLGGGPIVGAVPIPGFIKLLRTPIGALLVRLPMKRDRLLSILRENGHGASLDAGRVPDEFMDWRLALANDGGSMRHERDMVRAMLGRSGWRQGVVFEDRELGRVEAPVLLIYGSADPTGNVDLWRRVAATLPHCEYQVMDGAGHQPWFEDSDRVAAEVIRFLASAG